MFHPARRPLQVRTASAAAREVAQCATGGGWASAAAERQAANTATGQLGYGWDELNRITSLGTSTYAYRADGRARGEGGGLDHHALPLRRADGLADQEITGTGSVVTHYELGARGVDFIERVGTSTVTVFPLYDGHGNMVATLSRNGTSYSLNDQRSYGAWGEIRTGNTSGDPKGRYVSNLGHKQDDESGLIYMRARYYEPTRGRFVSEDPAKSGENWFSYAENNPVNVVDSTGRYGQAVQFLMGLLLMILGVFMMGAGDQLMSGSGRLTAKIHEAQLALIAKIEGLACRGEMEAALVRQIAQNLRELSSIQIGKFVKGAGAATIIGGAGTAIAAVAGYNMVLQALLIDIDLVGSEFDTLSLLFG